MGHFLNEAQTRTFTITAVMLSVGGYFARSSMFRKLLVKVKKKLSIRHIIQAIKK